MKYFVFGDVHGYYSLLMEELKKNGYDEENENHMLISLGDNFDRGPENYKMYEFLKKMKQKNKIILVKGNHEDLFLEMLYSCTVKNRDIHNGTLSTMQELSVHYFGELEKNIFLTDPSRIYKKLNAVGFIDFLYDMLDFYETKSYIFTHGFIPVNEIDLKVEDDWRNSTETQFKRSRWLNGIEMSRRYNFGVDNKKLVVGHFHTSYGNVRKKYGDDLSYFKYKELEFSDDFSLFDIYEDERVIAVDACTNYTKKINILVVDD